ncbi:hypothetical protein [Sphingobium fontiphilum]|nr:hypothetical protein [Sphingobium fontiphilum]
MKGRSSVAPMPSIRSRRSSWHMRPGPASVPVDAAQGARCSRDAQALVDIETFRDEEMT